MARDGQVDGILNSRLDTTEVLLNASYEPITSIQEPCETLALRTIVTTDPVLAVITVVMKQPAKLVVHELWISRGIRRYTE